MRNIRKKTVAEEEIARESENKVMRFCEWTVGRKNELEIMCVHVQRMPREMEIPMLRY